MKLNISLSILVQGYVSMLGIVLMPVYMHQLGAESFGLVGFFLMAQSWMQILDMGLTPALSREMSRMRAGYLDPREAALRLRSIEWTIGFIALGVSATIWATDDVIAGHWIHAENLSTTSVANCISLIGGAISLRWFAGLYRGILVGLERQPLVNILSAIFATLRFIGPIPLLIFVSTDPESFFGFQIVVSAQEIVVYRLLARRHVPAAKHVGLSLAPLIEMLPIVGSMAFLNVMWVMMTQVDKFILSGILNLRDYGHFTLAVAAAGGVLILVPPMNQVIQPRLTYLIACGETQAFQTLYRLASQLGVIGFVTLGGGLAFFSKAIIHLWTGDAGIAEASAPILFWYGLANAMVGIMLLPFMMQFAKGQFRLHVVGNVILLLTLIPTLVIATRHYGALGAGLTVFAANLLFLLAWSPIVHRNFVPELTWRWLFADTLPMAVLLACLLGLSAHWMPNDLGSLLSIAWIGGSLLFTSLGGLIAGGYTRRFLLHPLIAAVRI